MNQDILKSYLTLFNNTVILQFKIFRFLKLRAQLKRQSTEYKPKKPKIFERVDIMKFLEAPDEQYLFMKVINKL